MAVRRLEMDKLRSRITSFGAIGILITIAGAGVVLLLTALTGNPLLANVTGYSCGLILSYVLNSRYTFKSNKSFGTATKFLASFAVALTTNLVVVYLAVYTFHAPKGIGSLVGLPFYSLCFYILCERWAFKS